MVDFVSALKKPFSDPVKLIIGIIIGFIPIVSLLMLGYGLRTAKNTIKGDKSLPEWFADFGDLIIKTFMGIIISIIYLLIPIIVFVAAIFVGGGSVLLSLLLSGMQGQLFQSPQAMSTLLSGLIAAGGFILVAILLLLIAAFILPAALILFVKEDSLGAAFNIGRVFANVFTADYIVSWILAIIIGIIFLIIAMAFSVIPLIGVFIGVGLASFFNTVFSYSVFAEAVKK